MKPLFTILKIGLGFVKPEDIDSNDFCTMEQKDWMELRLMADKQAVSAIAFDGLSQIINTSGRDKICPNIDYGWWQQLVFDWIGIAHQTEYRNLQQKKVMDELADIWSSQGCRVMIFKGQANAIIYPKPDYRSPGDIDCYLFNDYSRGNEVAKGNGATVDEGWYKHSQILYKGELFENHRYFVHTRDGKRGKQLEKELEEVLNMDSSGFLHYSSHVLIPPYQWVAMFQTYHACAHFLSEGLRLKQVLDWAMFLEKHQNDVDWKSYYEFCDRNHLRKFADAMTSICVEYLCVNITLSDIYCHSPYTERVLNDMLYNDDYIYSEGLGAWECRKQVIKNLFKHRWKYEEIYDENVWQQLWYYVSGFLLNKE